MTFLSSLELLLKAELLDAATGICCSRPVTVVNNPEEAPLKRRPFDQIVGKIEVS
jgi:hypothetical protein